MVAETNTAVDLIFGYTGKQFDDATGLQHNLFRWYDSGLGQWLSEDPLGFEAGDLNVRSYVRNSPTNTSDPSGLIGVGHHWVSMAQLMKVATQFEVDSLKILIGSYSSALRVAHNRRAMGDVTHAEYDQAILRSLNDFLKNRKTKNLVTPAEAQQYAQDVYEGKVFNAADSVKIKKFNQAVMTEVRNLPDFVEPAKASIKDLVDKGSVYAKSVRGQKLMRLAKFASILGTLSAMKGAKDLIDASSQPMQITFRFIEAEDYDGARDAMLGNSDLSMLSAIRKHSNSSTFERFVPLFKDNVTIALSEMKEWDASFFK